MAASSRFGIEGGEHACEPEKFHPNLGRPAVDSLGPAWPDQPGKGGTCPGLASLAGRSRGHLARPFRRLGRALPRLRCREGAVVLVVGGLLVTLSVWAWVQPPKHYSETEERGLAWYLDPKWEDLADGSFAGDFAQHTQDQFPLRDSFRTVKGLSALKLLGQKDLDHLYQAGTYLAQMEYPLRPEMLDHAAKKIQWVYDTYLAGTDVTCYLSMIPGKNAYLAEEYGYPSLDYGNCSSTCGRTPRPWSMWTLPTCCPWRITTTPTAIGGRRRFWTWPASGRSHGGGD